MVARAEHALQRVVRGAQRAAEIGIAHGPQHRRTETRRFIVGERFDRAEVQRIEGRGFARITDRDHGNGEMARADLFEQIVARTVVQRRAGTITSTPSSDKCISASRVDPASAALTVSDRLA